MKMLKKKDTALQHKEHPEEILIYEDFPYIIVDKTTYYTTVLDQSGT